MSEVLVSKRYAQALHDAAVDARNVETVDNDVATLNETFRTSADLVRVFESPVVSREKKLAIVGRLFKTRVAAVTYDFLKLLVSKKRENLIRDVLAAYGNIRDEKLGVVEAQVRTAHSLRGDEESQLRARIESLTGSRVRLVVETDPSLIGGMVVRVGDVVYDGSVRNKLDDLRERFKTATYLAN